jgi:S1-C subfamily serine protease
MDTTRRKRVLVGSVRGRAGKSGIMRGDVVTHVNGEPFNGDASELYALLARTYEENGGDGAVTIVVNAEECTAEALRLRSFVPVN